ncbi:hypothetical protein EF903_05055 [Streptomyces sp. WAC05292]|nr:hypothetical protein EF903_05055 [Streptomyces sp. WAC05292]
MARGPDLLGRRPPRPRRPRRLLHPLRQPPRRSPMAPRRRRLLPGRRVHRPTPDRRLLLTRRSPAEGRPVWN